ncbi:MAG: LPS export ABC transporter permease LptG [Hyphomicrobiaceae bacterium]
MRIPGFLIVERYIASRFLLGIAGTFAICALLIFMIDMVELLRLSGKYGAVKLSTLAWMALLRLPTYTEFLLGFTVLTGSIGALLMLARKSELTVMRASGMSVWLFLRPGLIVAFLIGSLSVMAYNPLAALTRTQAEQLYTEVFGKDTANLLGNDGGGAWLRQDGADGQSILSAASATEKGMKLAGVSAFVFDGKGLFRERVEARSAELRDGYWQLAGAVVSRVGEPAQEYGTYLLSTYLTPGRVADALGNAATVSFWELPALIEVAEKASLSSSRLRIRYELLLSRPLLCIAMVLLAATVSLKSFRQGGIQTMVLTGMIGGFGFFLLAEVSRQLGIAGLAPAWAAVWLPVLLTIFASLTVLMHQEDG